MYIAYFDDQCLSKNAFFIDLIIKNIFKICKELGINSIAEGVETEEQFKALKKLGCDAVQGYLFNKPIPVKYFEELYI